jgi:ABC-type glycerol-3-phosphate transport system permease component
MAEMVRQGSGLEDVVSGQPKRRLNFFRIGVYVVLSIVALVYIMPFVWMIGKSVQNQFEANSTTNIFPTQGILLSNYTEVLFGSTDVGINNPFSRYLFNTIVLEVLSVSGQTVICVLGAYAFARMRFPGRDLLFGMLLLTIFVPSVILLVPNLIVITQISKAFGSIHESLKWLDNWPALVIPFLANTFSIFLLRQFFMQIPDDLWDAARIDGCGHPLFLVRIVVPISSAPIMTTILFCFIGVWSALEWPILVTSSINWRPIAVALNAFTSEGGSKLQLVMAASVIALLPIMILYIFTQRFFTQGISTTGLK